MSGADQYLLAIYIESQRGEALVASGTVADRLDRSAPAVTEMLQRLDDRGLVAYEPYNGATLTTAGRSRAVELHDSYVTLSWFFRSVLDLETHESEAMEMAGAIDPSVVDRLRTILPVGEQTELETPGG
jgi:DtxR family Mn-dependent transcriptional regulator